MQRCELEEGAEALYGVVSFAFHCSVVIGPLTILSAISGTFFFSFHPTLGLLESFTWFGVPAVRVMGIALGWLHRAKVTVWWYHELLFPIQFNSENMVSHHASHLRGFYLIL